MVAYVRGMEPPWKAALKNVRVVTGLVENVLQRN